MDIRQISVSSIETSNNSMSRSHLEVIAENGLMSKDQVRLLLDKLGSDDDFRQMYEESPTKALLQLGVSSGFIEQMKTRCLSPNQLAPKEVYLAASQRLTEEAAQRYATFVVPGLRFGFAS